MLSGFKGQYSGNQLGIQWLDEISDKGLRVVTATTKEIKKVEETGEA